jgi:hypothetical protein
VAIKRSTGKVYKSYLELVDLALVAGKNREVPKELICPGGHDVCPPFRDYCLPLVAGLPETETFEEVQ